MPELWTEPIGVMCPGEAPPCVGACTFRVGAHWERVPGAPHLRALEIRFEGRVHPLPSTSPELEEPSENDCRAGFNAGRGYIEYTEMDGTRHRLDHNGLADAFSGFEDTLSAADKAKRARILAPGRHCQQWTHEDREWMAGHGYPTKVGGWTLTWACQTIEGGSGMSVQKVSVDRTIKIKSFELAFDIDCMCICRGGAQNQDVLIVQLKHP